ncbi:MAG: IS3 family transposase [Alcaligenaceae bacterium]|nr:IS3 family transposase [Alcaligenaceae bacterium]
MDNTLIRRLFDALKCVLFYREKFTSIEQLEKRIHEYIYYYHHERVGINLKGLSFV